MIRRLRVALRVLRGKPVMYRFTIRIEDRDNIRFPVWLPDDNAGGLIAECTFIGPNKP